jgi:hypothetical protein
MGDGRWEIWMDWKYLVVAQTQAIDTSYPVQDKA